MLLELSIAQRFKHLFIHASDCLPDSILPQNQVAFIRMREVALLDGGTACQDCRLAGLPLSDISANLRYISSVQMMFS